MLIKISKDYSDTPGARYISEGPYSGEDFRKTLLKPKFLECLEKNEELIIDFDGSFGYSDSFLEESFGGLVRDKYDSNKILNVIKFISKEEIGLEQKVINYIREASKKHEK